MRAKFELIISREINLLKINKMVLKPKKRKIEITKNEFLIFIKIDKIHKNLYRKNKIEKFKIIKLKKL